jgi:hypothetical protein
LLAIARSGSTLLKPICEVTHPALKSNKISMFCHEMSAPADSSQAPFGPTVSGIVGFAAMPVDKEKKT